MPGLEPGPSDPESSTLTTGLLTPHNRHKADFFCGCGLERIKTRIADVAGTSAFDHCGVCMQT